jgi:hypothetical protein
MRGRLDVREIEDIGDNTLNFAQAKAIKPIPADSGEKVNLPARRVPTCSVSGFGHRSPSQIVRSRAIRYVIRQTEPAALGQTGQIRPFLTSHFDLPEAVPKNGAWARYF